MDTEKSQSEPSPGPYLKVGVLPSPGLATDNSKRAVEGLSRLLHDHVDDRYEWAVFFITDPLIGAEGSTTRILAKAEEFKPAEKWDYVVCVTDLPMFRRRRMTVAEASTERGVAVLSLPALGAWRVRKKLRESFLQLINELHHGSSAAIRKQQQRHSRRQKYQRLRNGLKKISASRLISGRFSDQFAPIVRQRVEQDAREIDVRFVSSHLVFGFGFLLAGMVRANRPFSIMPTFHRVLAVAFATGTYGLLFQTLWRLSNDYGMPRLVAMMLCSIFAMVFWLIVDHGLWSKRHERPPPALCRIYNLSTVMTLLIGVISYYIMLYVLFFLAVLLLVSPNLFAIALHQDIDIANYFLLAWLVTSVATIAGAVGGSLESNDKVRNATYGHRQYARYREAREASRFQPDDDSDA